MPRNTRIAVIVGAALAVALAGFVLLSPGEDDAPDAETAVTQSTPEATTSAPTTTAATTPAPAPEPKASTIRVRDGQPVGGVAELSVGRGDTVRFVVTTDSRAEIHVHGYDLEKEAAPGAPARFDFPAKITGRFEIELHPGTQIGQLDVMP